MSDKYKVFFETAHLKEDLKGRSVRGGVITLFAQVCKFVLQTGSMVVLARLLTPADFGLIAMVITITNFAMMFKDMGLSMATVQKAEINHAQISTLFWVNVAVGLAIALTVFALAPVVAWFFDEPRLTMVTMALAVTFVFGGLTVQHQTLLRRQMKFFQLGIVEISAMAVSVAAAIISGLYGAGYWSLVIMHLVLALSMAAGVWIAFPWLPGLPRKGTGVRDMLGFGGNVTGFNIVNYFARNADNILIGKFWGLEPLGLYSKAYNLLVLPLRQVNAPIASVAIPALSRLQNEPERYRKYYLKAISLISLLTMPGVVFMAVMSRELIRIVLGPQWEESGPIFCVLAIGAIMQPISNTTGWLFISQGRSKDMFRWGFIGSTITVFAIIMGLPWGVMGVAISYTVCGYAGMPLLFWFVGRKGPIQASDIYRAAALPIYASCWALTALLLFSKLTLLQNTIWEIIIGFGLTLITIPIALYMLPSGQILLQELIGIVSLLMKKKKI